MKCLYRRIEYSSRADIFPFFYFTDTHIGSKYSDEEQLQKDIEWVKNNKALWMHGGDAIDCIIRQDKRRYKESNYADWLHGIDDVLQAQVEHFAELFRPIKDQCVGILSGNHEEALLNYYGLDVYTLLIKELGLTNDLRLGMRGAVRLTFSRKPGTAQVGGHNYSVDIFAAHGYGSARTAGAGPLALDRMLGKYDATIVFMGHRHRRDMMMKEVLKIESYGKEAYIKEYKKFGFIVPGYKFPYDLNGGGITYEDRTDLGPTALGGQKLIITPDKKRIEAIMD